MVISDKIILTQSALHYEFETHIYKDSVVFHLEIPNPNQGGYRPQT